MQAFHGRCLFCLVVDKKTVCVTESNICPSCLKGHWREIETQFGKPYPAWRANDIDYKHLGKYEICYSCHTPQNSFEPPGHTGFVKGDKNHKYKSIMCRTAYLVRVQFGFKEELSPEAYGRWLVQRSEIEFTNMISVFLKVYAHVQKTS